MGRRVTYAEREADGDEHAPLVPDLPPPVREELVAAHGAQLADVAPGLRPMPCMSQRNNIMAP
jgi:hypothetical protein